MFEVDKKFYLIFLPLSREVVERVAVEETLQDNLVQEMMANCVKGCYEWVKGL